MWWLRLAGAVGSWLCAVPLASAQVPALLVGQWEVRQISFVTTQAVPDSVLDQMDNPQVANLNREMSAGDAHLRVEFRPDGTYQFVLLRQGKAARTEGGTYSVQRTTLLAQSPTTEGGSSFHDQEVVRLTRRTLVLTFPVGPALPHVLEEVEYRRLKP